MRAYEFLPEIRGGGLERPQLPSTQDFSKSSIIATVDGYSIHAFKYLPIFEIVLAVLDDNGTYKGYIGFSEDGHFIEANTLEQHRRKGIMSVLLLYTLRNVVSPLYINSGDIVSKFSRSAIWSLAEKNVIRISNENNEYYSKEKLYDILNDNWPNDYSLYLYPTHQQLKENYWEFRDVVTRQAYYDTNFSGESIEPYWYD